MAVTLAYLYEKSKNLYHMQVVAGGDDLQQPVEWIHMLEVAESAAFLRGQELVFFTGALYQDEEWLIRYLRFLKQHDAAGLVINVGPYIRQIPDRAIQFCNTYKLPLFSLPWNVHLVDITRYLCRFIIEDEKKGQSVLDYVKQILLFPEQSRPACMALELQGFNIAATFRIFVVQPKEQGLAGDEILMLLQLWHGSPRFFLLHNRVIGLLTETSVSETKAVVEAVQQYLADQHVEAAISVGSAVTTVERLAVSYKQALSIGQLAHQEQTSIMYYEDMGVYKLLVNGTPVTVLRQFYEDTLGPLEAYDATHEAKLMETLRYYVEHDCSIKDTAAHEVVHRNTILYKFNKIEQLLGKSLSQDGVKLSILMAFKIKDLL